MKAYHDKVEPYIERDISKLEVGDVLIADGHVPNFQVIKPFTGKPTRATLVGFLVWRSIELALLLVRTWIMLPFTNLEGKQDERNSSQSLQDHTYN